MPARMFPVSHSLSTDHGLGAQTRAGLGNTWGADEKRGPRHPAEGELKGAQGLEVGGTEQTAVGRQRKAGGRGRGRPPRTLWGTSRAQDWTLSVEGLFQDKWTAQRSLAAGRWAHRQRSPEAGRPAVTPPLSPENVKVKGTDSGTELPGLSPGSAASSVCLGRVTEILVLASVASSEKWDSQHAASRVWRVIESTAADRA